jgi:curli biogenesis system outer membrane secretion channel CsgG
MRRLMLIISFFVSAVLFVAAAGGLRAQQETQQPAKRHLIAVLNFNGSAVNGASQAVFGAQFDIGRGISQMLVARLASEGTYQVAARPRVEEVLKRRNLADGGLVDPATAAKIGYGVGADAVVLGEVTQFGWDDEPGKAEGTPAEPANSGGAVALAMRKAVVMITAQFIDANTGQVLVTANSKGVSRRSGTRLLDNAATAGSGGNLTMESSNFVQSMIGEATAAAVNELAKELEGENANLPKWTPPPLKGQITEASNSNIIINVGSAAGLKVGDKMLVTRVVHVERDRVTESAVGAVEDEVGMLTIVSVKDDSAMGHFSGAESAKVGDQVRPLQ